MNDTLGYNREKVEELGYIINNTAKSVGNDVPEILRNGIVLPMSTIWYAPEAVDFFSSFSELVKYSGNAITEIFTVFRDFVQNAGTNWAENTGGEVPTLIQIDTVVLNLDISLIQPNNSGDVSINRTEAMNVANNLEILKEEIKSRIQELVKNLDAETAFIGGNQSEALQNCFLSLTNEIQKIFDYLTAGDNSVKTKINNAVEKYGDISQNISNEFVNNFINDN